MWIEICIFYCWIAGQVRSDAAGWQRCRAGELGMLSPVPQPCRLEAALLYKNRPIVALDRDRHLPILYLIRITCNLISNRTPVGHT